MFEYVGSKIGSLQILQVLDELWLIELWHEVQPLTASSEINFRDALLFWTAIKKGIRCLDF
jgi:hypothetical protein